MSYKAFATSEEVCQKLCAHEIGEQVHIKENMHLENGTIEAGTMLVIERISLRNDIRMPLIYQEAISNYCADPSLFVYALYDPVSKQHFHCTGGK